MYSFSVVFFSANETKFCFAIYFTSSSMEVNDGKYYVEQCRTLCQTIRNDSTDAAVKIAAGLVDACRQASTTKNLTLSDLWNELEDENKNLLTDFVGCFEVNGKNLFLKFTDNEIFLLFLALQK